MVFTDSTSIGVRKDLQGVLLIDTALQTPLSSQENIVKVELLYADVSCTISRVLYSFKLSLQDSLHTCNNGS